MPTTLQEQIKNSIKIENGIPYLTDEAMPHVSYYNVPEKIELDDLMMVHITNFFPKNGIILSASDANATVEIQGELYSSHRTTVHFALNDVVASHVEGNFDNRSIIIVDPLKNHINDVIALDPTDTWLHGSVQLSNEAIIIVSEEKIKEIPREDLQNLHVIVAKGNMKEVLKKVILLTGKCPYQLTTNGWTSPSLDENDRARSGRIFNTFKEQYYPNLDTGKTSHQWSYYRVAEDNLGLREQKYNLLKGTSLSQGNFISTKNGISLTLDDLYQLLKQYPQYSKEKFISKIGLRYNSDKQELEMISDEEYLSLLLSGQMNEFEKKYADCLDIACKTKEDVIDREKKLPDDYLEKKFQVEDIKKLKDNTRSKSENIFGNMSLIIKEGLRYHEKENYFYFLTEKELLEFNQSIQANPQGKQDVIQKVTEHYLSSLFDTIKNMSVNNFVQKYQIDNEQDQDYFFALNHCLFNNTSTGIVILDEQRDISDNEQPYMISNYQILKSNEKNVFRISLTPGQNLESMKYYWSVWGSYYPNNINWDCVDGFATIDDIFKNITNFCNVARQQYQLYQASMSNMPNDLHHTAQEIHKR